MYTANKYFNVEEFEKLCDRYEANDYSELSQARQAYIDAACDVGTILGQGDIDKLETLMRITDHNVNATVSIAYEYGFAKAMEVVGVSLKEIAKKGSENYEIQTTP